MSKAKVDYYRYFEGDVLRYINPAPWFHSTWMTIVLISISIFSGIMVGFYLSSIIYGIATTFLVVPLLLSSSWYDLLILMFCAKRKYFIVEFSNTFSSYSPIIEKSGFRSKREALEKLIELFEKTEFDLSETCYNWSISSVRKYKFFSKKDKSYGIFKLIVSDKYKMVEKPIPHTSIGLKKSNQL